MKILCATDFSPAADTAATVAALMAVRDRASLELVHVVPPAARERTDRTELARRRELLKEQAARLRKRGCTVVEEMLEGSPDTTLLAHAHGAHCSMIVIGPHGEHAGSPWHLGSLAIRLIKGAEVPVLVVRNKNPIEAWTERSEPLRVVVGLDRTETSQRALAWSHELARIGPIELVAGHVYSPAEVSRRHWPEHVFDAHRDVRHLEAALSTELNDQLAPVAQLEPRLKLMPGWGRVAYHLLDLVDGENANLLVIGTHRRQGLDRLWRGSVSLDLAAHARCNVLTVPSSEVAPGPTIDVREIRRVLVPCDLSRSSARAVAWACALLPRGGQLHLLHIVLPPVPMAPDFGGVLPLPPPTREELANQTATIERELRALVPEDVSDSDIEIAVEVHTAFDPAAAIVQESQRIPADAICMTTHGRSGLSRALLGSVAESVLRRAHVPILLLTPPRSAAEITKA